MHSDYDPQDLLKIDGELERLAVRLVGGDGDADDVRQEAWLSAAKGRAQESSSLGGWLKRALKFRGMRRHRDVARRLAAERNARPQRLETETPADILERSEVRLVLLKAVSSLDATYRRTISLAYFEDLTANEIAEVMKVPIDTVRTRLRRGLELLRAKLDHEYGDREAWAIAILPLGLGLSLAKAAASSGTAEILNGVLVMSGKVKAAFAVGFIVAVTAVIIHFNQEETTPELDVGSNKNVAENEVVQPRQAHKPAKKAEALANKTGEEANDTDESTTTDGTEVVNDKEARLELKFVYGPDEIPAGEVPVTILPFGVRDPFFCKEEFRTDKAGLLTLEAYHVGRCFIRTAVGGGERINVEAGKVNRATIKIPLGIKVTGQVVSAENVPVAGAEILVTEFGHPVTGQALTHSGPDGRFTVKNIGAQTICQLGARFAGYLPSPKIFVFTSKGGDKNLKLILGGPAGRFELLVVDPDNKPVPRARCLVGERNHRQMSLEDGNSATVMSRTDCRTDEDGRIVLQSMAEGDLPFTVRGPGFAAITGKVKIEAGKTTRHRVVLQPGGIVKGIITDANDKPLKGVQVTVGMYGDIDSHFMRTDDEGRFLFEDVSPGKRKIYAEKSKVGETGDNIEVHVGRTTEWTAQLITGASIVGIVEDDAGNPVKGISVSVQAFKENRFLGGFGKTDATGRFEIKNLDETIAFALEVRGGDGVTEIASVKSVKPGPDLVRITVPRDAVGVASLSGRVIGPDGRAISGATISARRVATSSSTTGIESTDGEGRFKFPKVAPGKYSFSMKAPEFGHVTVHGFEVLDGQDLDVGDLQFQKAGRLQITLPEDINYGDLTVWCYRVEGGSNLTVKITGAVTLSQPLSPAKYYFTLRSKEFATRSAKVDIIGGETTEVSFDVVPGKKVRFPLVDTPDMEKPSEVTYKLYAPGGKLVCEGKSRRWQDRPITFYIEVAKARHRLVVTAPDGRTSSINIPAETPEEMPVNLK